MSSNHTSKPVRGRARRILLGGVCAVALGALAAGQVFFLPHPGAQAQNLSEQVTQPRAVFSFANVVEKVEPAVVSIRIRAQSNPEMTDLQGIPNLPDDHPLEEFFRRFGEPGPNFFGNRGQRQAPEAMAQGSGFFISADGYVVTNNHVVENAKEVSVSTSDGTAYKARVIGSDPKTDVALVKIDGKEDFPHVSFAKDETRVGDWVVAVGNPFGLGGSVTAGIISARGRDIGAGPYDDFIQIDAPINKGNSGGPAFNINGEVIGVNTAIYSPSGGSVGIGFAIPARTVETVVQDLKDDGQVTRGWIGVRIQPVTEDIAASLGLEEAKGALVTEPQANSPATKAGIKVGDAILAVNGEKVESARSLARMIAAYPPDTVVDVTLWRNDAKATVKVKLDKQPDEERLASTSDKDPMSLENYGLALAPAATSGAGDSGVVVTGVDPEGAAAEKGIREGDIILDVAGSPVSTPSDVVAALGSADKAGRKAVLVRVKSGDQLRFVALTVERG